MADEIYVKHNYCNYTDLLPNKLENGNLYFVRDDGVYFDLYNERRKIGPVINDRDSTFTDVDESTIPTSGVVKEAIQNNQIWHVLELTWEDIVANNNYATDYPIGTLVDLDFGEYGIHPMELVEINEDDKSDGTGKARMTWISKDIVFERQMTQIETGTTSWGYGNLDEFLNQTVINQLPSVVKDNIVEVNKTYREHIAIDNVPAVNTRVCPDKLWIPSLGELAYTTDGAESSGSVYTYFNNLDNLDKKYNGQSSPWWLRTNSYYGNFFAIDKDGPITNIPPTDDCGIVIGFCL